MVFSRWLSRWRGPHWRSVSGAHLGALVSADIQSCRADPPSDLDTDSICWLQWSSGLDKDRIGWLQWPRNKKEYLIDSLNEISIFKKTGQQKEAWSAPKFLGKWVQWHWFSKNTMDKHQQMTLHPKSSKTVETTLDFKQLGLWASPPLLQTLGPWFPNEIQNLLSSEKRTLGNSPVLLLLSPGKTPLTTTVAKLLDTSVCGGSWCLYPSLSPFLVKFTQILESILLDNPHKAAVLSVGCASFSSTLFPSTQLSVGYSTLWTASFFCNECFWLTLFVKSVNDCLLGQLSDQQSSPWLCSLVN